MRRTLVVLMVVLAMAGGTVARAGTMAEPQTVLDKTFTLDPNDESRFANGCFDAPYGAMMTVIAMTLDEDTNSESVTLHFKEGDFTRLKTSLSTNPTIMTNYAGAGTYCYSLAASHVHLDTIAPVRQVRLIITADSSPYTP